MTPVAVTEGGRILISNLTPPSHAIQLSDLTLFRLHQVLYFSVLRSQNKTTIGNWELPDFQSIFLLPGLKN